MIVESKQPDREHARPNVGNALRLPSLLVRPMRIAILVDAFRVLGWHLRLARELRAAGQQVEFWRSASERPWPAGLRAATRLEQLIFRIPDGQLALPAAASEVRPGPANGWADILVNATGGLEGLPAAGMVLTPIYDGHVSELSAWDAIADGRNVELGVATGARTETALISAHVALENPGSVVKSMNNIFSGVGELLLKLVTGPELACRGSVVARSGQDHSATHFTFQQMLGLATRVATKIARRLDPESPRWAVAWRRSSARGLLGHADAEPAGGFRVLGDDGQRYYADPFLFTHQGRTHLFVEEFPHAGGKGIISVCEIGPDGPVGSPRIVIEEPTHLSYPFVFEEDGQIWMLPESGASRAVTLYRCVRFPDLWAKEIDLVRGVALYDATLHRARDGTCWMWATPEGWQATTWDRLSVYHAPSLHGPWAPLPGNPVQIDARSSRSAGKLLQSGECLLRPAQDGSSYYGGAIALCRVDELSKSGFRQTVVGRIHGRHRGAECGLHTYNRHLDLEVVDIFGNIDPDQPAFAAYRPSAGAATAAAITA